MPLLKHLPAIFSSLFRLLAYVFLRVIPSPHIKLALPGFYALHIFSSWILLSLSGKGIYERAGSDKIQVLDRDADRDSLTVILFSLSSTSRRLRLTNIFLNTLLLCAAADFVFAPFVDSASDVTFTRVGAVYPDSIKIVARYPQFNTTEHGIMRVIFREQRIHALDVPWKNGPIMVFRAELDWVDTAKLGGLWPNTSYEYALSAINETQIAYPKVPIRFRTFPDPRLPFGNRFRFIVSSCAMPNYPYLGPFHRRSIKGFDLLANYLFPDSQGTGSKSYAEIGLAGFTTSSQKQPDIPLTNGLGQEGQSITPSAEFILFLGDFIYADVPLYAGDNTEAYRRLYRRNYQSHSLRRIYEHLPMFHAYDDHEFINNFGANGNDSTPPYPHASDAFRIYNSDANYDPTIPGRYYYDFQYGDTAFFVMDTRRYRSDIKSPIPRSMLGDEQLKALLGWLSRVNGTSNFKFIASSVPFTSLWKGDAVSDSWAGFPEEKRTLLEAFYSVPNVIVLSGDRHEFAAIEFSSANPDVHVVREFSTSPMSMFYIPFVRTLRMKSDTIFKRNPTNDKTENDGPVEVAEEQVLKYIPIGNYKWSTFEIDTRDSEKPILRLEVMIDGRLEYRFKVVGKSEKLPPFTALGAFVPSGMKDILHKFGVKPNRWF